MNQAQTRNPLPRQELKTRTKHPLNVDESVQNRLEGLVSLERATLPYVRFENS
jgi:hypothetical protein